MTPKFAQINPAFNLSNGSELNN